MELSEERSKEVKEVRISSRKEKTPLNQKEGQGSFARSDLIY